MTQTHSDGDTNEPRFLRKGAFAKFIGVSAGRVSQMIAAGLPVQPDGRIDVKVGKLWVNGNVSPVRSAAQARGGEQCDLPFPAQPSANQERLRLLREQADHAALKNAALRRELVPAADVQREWEGMLRLVRSGVLAAPSRLRQMLPHLSTDDFETIDGELRRTLEDIANAE